MAEKQWTPAQAAAIQSRGGTLLVSAAAGSGKTAVLVERVVSLITDPHHPVDADRLLVVTFSNAAAQEMRQRIAARLWELSRQQRGNPNLERQTLLLESAQISTVHAFCSQLLRSYFHRLGLPPQFRVGEEQELRVLQLEVLQQVLQQQYEEAAPEFLDLAELLSSARSDQKLGQTILKFYGFVRNHPFYEQWLERTLTLYDSSAPVEETPWGRILLDYAGQGLRYALSLCDLARQEAEQEPQMADAYLPVILEDRALVERCLAAVDSGNWDRCCQVVGAAAFGRIGSLPRQYPHPEKKDLVAALRKEYKALVTETLKNRCFLMDSALYHQDAALQRPMMSRLFQILLQFDRALTQEKLERNLLDFDDQQHYTLALLYQLKEGQLQRTDIGEQLARHYQAILVDEYQDTNELQEQIFRAISRDLDNVFMVGDVKQSIYRFRQARPELFLQKKEHYPPYDGATYPAKIALDANFRTRGETTGLINDLFAAIMSPTVGEMDYGEEDALVARADYDDPSVIPVTLALVDGAGDQGNQAEADYVAAEIRRLLDAATPIQGKEGLRPIRPGDICILLRSRTRMAAYTQALDRLRISHWEEQAGGFLESREISPVVACLKLLANPLLDMELAEVLLSPLYGYTSQDLAWLRSRGSKEEPLYTTVTRLSGAGEGRFDRFLQDYRALRRLSMEASVQEVLLHLYDRTGALPLARAMPQGENREANLRRLLQVAADREAAGGTFADFVFYLYALEEWATDLPAATAAAGNAVSLMTVHKSKGLEFPVVFFVGTGSKFNLQDLSEDVQLHPELGLACKYRDNRRLVQHETLPRAAMSLENRRGMLSEEMRILYVAMTRARERLYLTGCDPQLKKWQKAPLVPTRDGRLLPWAVRSATCLLDWLTAALCHHPDLAEAAGAEPWPGAQGRITLVLPQAEQEEAQQQEAQATPVFQPNRNALDILGKAIRFTYPHLADTTTLSKQSVSDLTQRAVSQEFLFVRRPKALTAQQLTPVERGVAAHKFMQFAQYQAASQDLEQEISRLRDQGFLTGEEAEGIDRATLQSFFQGSLGRRVLAADTVYREIRFLREFTPGELAAIHPSLIIEGSTVIQGVADCVLVEEGRGTVIDYKTDQVKDPEELIRRYRIQLQLYKKILEDHLDLPIDQLLIYSFALARAVPVPIERLQ